MRLSETTNGKIQEVLAELRVLADWADADAQHAAENDARETAKDDRCRARELRRAIDIVAKCSR